jgi:hypothetical protein
LDDSLRPNLKCPVRDLSVPVYEFCNLYWPKCTVVITENKMNFLTLPSLPNAIGIWGGGGAAELLVSVDWLKTCRLIYWGDIDVHGFHILSRLRRSFPELVSVMMDMTTLERLPSLIGTAKAARYEDCGSLTVGECSTYEKVKQCGWLLEQEKIPQSYAVEQLSRCIATLG